MSRDEPPKGERGTVRFPWDVLPWSAVRDSNGTVWARDVDSGQWFDVWSGEHAEAFRAKPLPGQCADCGHNADMHDTEDGHCLVGLVDGQRCDCAGFEAS